MTGLWMGRKGRAGRGDEGGAFVGGLGSEEGVAWGCVPVHRGLDDDCGEDDEGKQDLLGVSGDAVAALECAYLHYLGP